MSDGYVQRPEHFTPKERVVGKPLMTERPSDPPTVDTWGLAGPQGHNAVQGAVERAVDAVTRDGWHEAYNLNPEDWQEAAYRMLSAVGLGDS